MLLLSIKLHYFLDAGNCCDNDHSVNLVYSIYIQYIAKSWIRCFECSTYIVIISEK